MHGALEVLESSGHLTLTCVWLLLMSIQLAGFWPLIIQLMVRVRWQAWHVTCMVTSSSAAMVCHGVSVSVRSVAWQCMGHVAMFALS